MVLADFLAPGLFKGASLILRQNDRFLFGIRPPKKINGLDVLEITGIGGRLEAFDSSLVDCVHREAREEIAAQIKIVRCPLTLVVRGFEDIQEIALQGDEQPAALVFRRHRTPPHQPWHINHIDTGCIAVFLADLIGPATPSPEIPYLIWLTPDQILDAARYDLALEQLMNEGAEVAVYQAQTFPTAAITRLTDSQEALSLALGEQTKSFYKSLL
jgi:8-oxo-dGTP pyrophosphatase MutT (NUDIX family)